MGSFMEYHNKKNNTTATNKTSSSSSFMEYHNKRQKEREEEEERRKVRQQSQENINNFQSKIDNKEFSTVEDLQKEYDKLSTTEKAQIAKQINSKSGAEKIALSSNKLNNAHLINLDETKLKTEKDLKIDNLKTDAKAIGSNLLNSAKVGGTQLLKSMAMNMDKTQNMHIDNQNMLLDRAIKEREEEGQDTSQLKQLYREKYDSKPFYQEKIDKLNQKMAENTEKATNPTSRKIAEISQGLGNNIVGAVATAINPTAGLVYFTGSAKGSYYDEAIQRGMSEEEAENYSGVMALMEGVTERYLAGENIKGFKNILEGQGFKNAVKSFGIEVGENFVQEAVMPSISEVTALATAGKEHLNYDFTTAEGWENLLADSWSDGIDGALSSIMLNGATKGVASATRVVNKMKSGQTVTQQEIATAVEDSQKAGVDIEEILQEEIVKSAKGKITQNNQALQQQNIETIKNTEEVLPTVNKQNAQVLQNNNEEGIIEKYRDNPPRLQVSNDIISTDANASSVDSIPQNNNNVQEQIRIDSEKFSKQVDAVKNGTFPKNDMLVLGNTPQVLKDIGLPDLPITMTQKHLDTIMNESGKYAGANYHNLGEDLVKQLPEAINNPLDVVKSNTKDDSVVLTTYLADKQNRTIIASIKIDGKGTVNDIRIDTNVMTSAYGRNNYEKFMQDNIKNGNLLYDIDRGVIKKVTGERLQLPIRSNFSSSDAKTRLQLPRISNTTNTINNSITPQNENVNYTNKYAQQVQNNTQNNNNVAPSVENNVLATGEYTEQQTEIKEHEKIAEVLEKTIGKVSEKNRTVAILKANLIDKGMVFEELSRKTNNRELQGKWDYILTAEARGQNAIGQARYEMDAKTKTEKQISKSLEDIRIEVGDKTSDFQNYMYHQLNIDRMTLEERFSGDTGINYERKGNIKNKPVFGKSVTADISKKIVAEYEQKNPEFKKWAKDVYDFLDANKKELVDKGVISQELSDKLSELYPHYVPIKRVNAKGLAIKVPLDTNRTGINSPLAKATGGSSDIQPLFQTIADRTLQTYKASARNNFGVELMNTLNSVQETSNADIDTILEEIGDENTELLHEGKNGNPPTFTVFENGEKKTFEITKDMYDALKPQSEWIKQLNNNKVAKFFNKVSNFRRGVLTEYNALFSLTNPVKDFQGIVINSEHPAKTFAKFGEAYAQITKKGYWYNEYIRNGGKQNSYFKDGEFTSDKKNSRLKTAVKIPFETISKVNNVIEMAPRLAEYIASREGGRSIEVSMLDAARVTTNFKAGGDFTKTLNRNGFTFLNASVQGFQQQVRNIQDAHAKGLKGYAVLATKYAIAGLPTIIFNYIVWKDDEDYEELQDYVKDNYYCIAKYGDGKFIRIPKERVTATIQKIVSNATEYVTDDKELNIDNVAKDFWENLNFAIDNLAPNNPLDNNVLSPIIQTITNTSWYGEDIVPSRLQDKPKAEQYDETTDSLSIWLGEKLNQSPYKINYLLDQYGGGISDIVLPRFTKQAENNVFADKFTTDATMKSKYPGEFYTKLDELKVNANSDKATDEDIIKYKYASTISSEISELYNEKREIQNSSLSDNTKKEKLKLVQEKINKITKESLDNISSLKISGNTATIGDIQFYKDGTAQWNKVSKKEQQKNKNISLKTYADYKNKTESMKKDSEKINVIVNGNYTNKEKTALYENYILSETDEKYSIIKETGIDINEYLKYKLQEFFADKEDDGTIDGKTVNGSKATKVWNYIENMNISYTQKLLLYGLEHTPSDSQQKQILNYVKSLPNKTNKEKLEILSQFKGFTIYKDGTVEY